MFGTNHSKLKSNLKLAIQRLKLLEKKKLDDAKKIEIEKRNKEKTELQQRLQREKNVFSINFYKKKYLFLMPGRLKSSHKALMYFSSVFTV